jgi:single-strand DNA-binding protein
MTTTIVSGHVGTVRLNSKPGKAEEGGFTVLNFTVASNSVTKSGKEVTNWVTCKLWGPRAESLSKHLVKGQGVIVEGRPEARAYQGNDGSVKSDLVVHVNSFEFMGPKPENAPSGELGEEVPESAGYEL